MRAFTKRQWGPLSGLRWEQRESMASEFLLPGVSKEPASRCFDMTLRGSWTLVFLRFLG